MENEAKKSWTFFTLIIIILWILFSVIGFFVFNININDIDVLNANLLYYGLFMFLLTYYSAKKYKETGSHRSYLLVDIPLIALAFIISISLRYYISIIGIF